LACGSDSTDPTDEGCTGESCLAGEPVCGDGVCDDGETCAQDCEAASVCGDGVCDDGESCTEDCEVAPFCGDGVCGDDESSSSCEEDCGPCTYPEGATHYLTFGQVAPAMSWEDVFDGGTERTDFSMEAFHCAPEYERYQTLAIVVGAGWCVACPDYFGYVDSLAPDLDTAGMLVAYVETEDRNYIPSDHESANEAITDMVGTENGLRIGDGETQPESRQIYDNPTLVSFPTAYVVRRSDMIVITEQNLSDYILPFDEIAADPDADWSNPGAGSFEPACGPEDEEPYEPNDDPLTAPTIELGSFEGGICAPTPDYYRIEEEGPWRLDLEFTHATGDLDMYVWDFDQNEPDPSHGSDSTTDDESLYYVGPATVMIYGYRFASAPYTLTLSEAEPICPEGTEEDYEPNDTVEQAAAIEPGTFSGGICDFNPDFYSVSIEGDWQLDLTFSHAIGDLDVYVWDVANDQPVMDGENPVGSDSTDDNESFQYSGPAIVFIYGYRGAQAPYELTLTEL
jgi:hypothetical protein